MRRILKAAVTLLLTALPLGVCAQPVEEENSAVQKGENAAGPSVKWMRSLRRHTSHAKISVHRGALYILTAEQTQKDREGPMRLMGEIQALAKDDGGAIWSVRVEEKFPNRVWLPFAPASMACAGDLVCFQLADTLHAVSRESGREKWTFEAPEERLLHAPPSAEIPRRILLPILGTCALIAVVVAVGRALRLKTRVRIMAILAIVIVAAFLVHRQLSALRRTLRVHPSSFQVSGGLVYHSSSKGSLYALAADTGQLRWRFDPVRSLRRQRELPYVPAPVISHGVIVIPYNVRKKAKISPVVNALLPFATSPLAGLNAETGKVLWTARKATATWLYHSEVAKSPVASDGTIYAIGDDSVVALSAKTGSLKWRFDRFEIDKEMLKDDLEQWAARIRGREGPDTTVQDFKPRHAGPAALLAIENGSLYVLKSTECTLTSVSSDLHRMTSSGWIIASCDVLALSANTGDLKWRKHIGIEPPEAAIAANGALLLIYQAREGYNMTDRKYTRTGRDTLQALSSATGEILWEFEGPRVTYGNKVTVHDKTAYFVWEDRLHAPDRLRSGSRLHAVDLPTGTIKWEWESEQHWLVKDGSRTYERPFTIAGYAVGSDGIAYVCLENGEILALDPGA